MSFVLGGRAGEVLHELPGRVRALRALVDDGARRVDRRRLAGRALRQRRDPEVDARRPGGSRTSHEPLASIAAWPCSKASPSASVIAASGMTLSFQIRSWRNWMPPAAWSVPSEASSCRRREMMSPPFCQTSSTTSSSPCRWSRCRSPTGSILPSGVLDRQLLARPRRASPSPTCRPGRGCRPRRTSSCCSRGRSTLRSRGSPNWPSGVVKSATAWSASCVRS